MICTAVLATLLIVQAPQVEYNRLDDTTTGAESKNVVMQHYA